MDNRARRSQHPVRAKNCDQVSSTGRFPHRLGIVITSPIGDRLEYVLQIHFKASKNVAECEAVIHGHKMAKEIGIPRILCFGDSDLVMQ